MKIIISGVLGRMGQTVVQAAKSSGIQIVCGVDAAVKQQTSEFPLVKTYKEIPEKADVIIDFSIADNLEAVLGYALESKTPAVLCATGYSDQQLDTIKSASEAIPVLQSANMSFGVQVLARLAAIAARVLGSDYDIEIIEKHHNQKIDSPSGTALMLADAVSQERGIDSAYVFGREGRTGVRNENEIGIHAVRGGTVTGEHEVGFYGDAEEILITHRAESRALFARGALRGAEFLNKQPPGLYTLKDAVADLIG